MHIITAAAVSVHQTELFSLEVLPRKFSLTMANHSIPDNGTNFFHTNMALNTPPQALTTPY